MYQYQIKRQPDSEIVINVNIPKATIDNHYNTSLEELRKELTVEGFRKGTVPKKIAEKKIQKEKVYERVLQHLLPKIYQEVVQKENLRPIINPRIDLEKAKEGEDWQIVIKLAERPKIDLKNYKKLLAEANKKNKKTDLWLPGQSVERKKEENEEDKKLKDINEIFNLLLKEINCPIPGVLIEEELNRKLASLVDELQKIGLTIESYLKSKNLTLEQLKESYKKEIIDTYRLEFILQEIADKENIVVDNKDIEKLFTNIKDEKERLLARQNSYLYAALLRKQKTIDFLLNL